MTSALAILIGEEGTDALLAPLATALRRRSLHVEIIAPGQLATRRIATTTNEATFDGSAIAVAVFRAPIDVSLADAFAEDDRSFATSETRAILLHAMSLPSVRCVNRGDPGVWFALSEWPIWRRRLTESGVAVAPIVVGDMEPVPAGRWLQWGGGDADVPTHPTIRRSFGTAIVSCHTFTRSLWCFGTILEGPAGPGFEPVGRVLEAHGVALAAVDMDTAGRVVSVTSRPPIAARSATDVAQLLADRLTR